MSEFAGIISTRLSHASSEMSKMISVMHLPQKADPVPLIHDGSFHIGASPGSIYTNATKSMSVSFSGQLFNLEEIIKSLVEVGQVVPGDNLHEILILGFLTWGTDFFAKLNGPFILFIYNHKKHHLTIARDQMGSRRLFWSEHNNHFIFATQLKGMLASSLVLQEPDSETIASYFYLGYFPQDKTPIKHLNRLLPGYYIEIDRDQNLVIDKYWSFKTLSFSKKSYTPQEVTDQLDHLLLDSVKKRLPKDGKPSCLLAGDTGSTSIAYYLKNKLKQDPKAYAMGFTDHEIEHLPHAKNAANKLNLSFDEQILGPQDMLSELQQVIWHLDEPIADPRAVGVWKLAKSMKGKTKTVFSAIGSDEFLGTHLGHSSLFYEPIFLWFMYLSRPLFTKGLIPIVDKVHKRSALKMLRYFQKDFWALEYMKQNALFSNKALKQLAPSLHKRFDQNLFLQQSYQYLKFILYQQFDVEDYLFFDAETTLCNRKLHVCDRLFQAHDINLECPFIDKNVMEFLIQVPEPLKSRNTKAAIPLQDILKKGCPDLGSSYFPKKNPWLLNGWIKDPKILEVFNLLPRGVLVQSGIIEAKTIQKELTNGIWKYHQFERLWSILVLEIWFNLFVNQPVHTYPKEGSIIESMKQHLV